MKKIALVGIGKIAIDQHVPAIARSDDWELTATVSRAGTVDGVPSYTDFDLMLAENANIKTVSLCLPPVPRYSFAKRAIEAGRNVMLEKPPGATLAEVYDLADMAERAGVSLYTTWHSRMAKGVFAAKEFLADKSIVSGKINWKEDVRRWHPNQEWVFEPGGMGVFDPGSNALSILTEILPKPVHLLSAELRFPENRFTPIAADLSFSSNITAELDWLQEGDQTWEIKLDTDSGSVLLTEGGNRCFINGTEVSGTTTDEYPALYIEMTRLVEQGKSDVDVSPMMHVADAMTLGRRVTVAPFSF